jgi:hypothetical protein
MNAGKPNSIDSIKQQVQLYAGKRPLPFYSLLGLRRKYRELAVSKATQLVIEGFPRSGNTFAVVAFRQAQQESISIASHLHAPAQVIRAARWEIPTLVLIRNPVDAVLSLVIRHPHISTTWALKSYISFYETITSYRHAYVIGPFDEVIEDYGAVIERVNARFSTRFSPFDHTEDNVGEIFARIESLNRAKGRGLVEEQIARPSAAREELRSRARGELKARRPGGLIAKAEAIYSDLTVRQTGECGWLGSRPKSQY